MAVSAMHVCKTTRYLLDNRFIQTSRDRLSNRCHAFRPRIGVEIVDHHRESVTHPVEHKLQTKYTTIDRGPN